MPHVNLYIREEDWEAFQAIQNRPEWLHQAIVGATDPNMAEVNDLNNPAYSARVRPDIPLNVNPKSRGPVDE